MGRTRISDNALLPPPYVEQKANGYYYSWRNGDAANIAIGITHIREDLSRNAIEAEIEIGYFDPNVMNDTVNLISYVRMNLLSISGRDSLIRTIERNALSEELRYYPWHTMINQICNKTIYETRKGEPVIQLTEEYGKQPPTYLLPPLFVKDATNIIYADRSSAKSLFVTMIDIALTLPWHDNEIGLMISHEQKPSTTLYLDWESNAQICGWQKECIRRGMGLEWCDIPYLHCNKPLVDLIDHIKAKIDEVKAEVIIIDSLGMAVGDDLNLTKPAFAFYNALRQLPVTPIIVAHTAKDANNRRKTVYGNAYYENEARSVWEINKTQNPGDNFLTFTMHQRKPPPFSPLHEPLAFLFTFEGNAIYISSTEPEQDKRSLMDETPPSETDIALEIIYTSHKRLTAQDILVQSEGKIKPTNIYTVLGRIVKKPEFKINKDINGTYGNIK